MNRQYYVIFEHGKKGSIGAYSPDFPGCISTGDNLEEAKANIIDVIEFYLEDCEAPVVSGLKTIEDVIFEDYKNDNVKVIMQVEVVIPVKKSRRVNITMPENVLDNIETYLKKHKEKENRSGLLAEAAIEYMVTHA